MEQGEDMDTGVSKRAVKVGLVASSDDSDLDSNDCRSFDYQPRDGVPGFYG